MASLPLEVVYCPTCGMPPEFCQNGPPAVFEKCKPWLLKHFPEWVPGGAPAAKAPESEGAADGGSAVAEIASSTAGLSLASSSGARGGGGAGSDDDSDDGSDDDSDSGDSAPPPPKKGGGGGKGAGAASKTPKITITKKDRGRGKSITIVKGLDGYGIKLKEAASALGKKFGAGATVGKSAEGVQQVEVQGDLLYDLPETLEKLYGAQGVKEDNIVVKD